MRSLSVPCEQNQLENEIQMLDFLAIRAIELDPDVLPSCGATMFRNAYLSAIVYENDRLVAQKF